MQFTLSTVLTLATAAAAVSPMKNHLQSRADGDIMCEGTDLTEGHREREAFVEGQEYLRGGIVCSAANGDCSRVSCSNDAAVWFCNNSGQDINMDCGIFADYIDHIFDRCQEDGLYAVDMAVGQQENTDGWVVEVGKNSC